jgi:hypothetical protein
VVDCNADKGEKLDTVRQGVVRYSCRRDVWIGLASVLYRVVTVKGIWDGRMYLIIHLERSDQWLALFHRFQC